MGKNLWRQHSYVRVENDQPGCIWTVFRMLNYHPWHNVKRMLPYKKHKPHGKSTKSNEIRPNDETHKIIKLEELDEDTIMKNSASVSSSPSRTGSLSKKSMKARIKALMAEKDHSTKLDLLQESDNLLAHEHKCDDDHICAPTLMTLLKANPKLIRTISRVDESSNPRTSVKHKGSKEEDYVGVLELFKVDQDMFLQILQDSPPRKPRLVKSGSFPSPNPSRLVNFGRTPSKVEHKHNEVWPVSYHGHELRKVKSQRFARSMSHKESMEKYGHLLDTSNNKEMKKRLSKSFKFTNEKEFTLLGENHGGRSFKERLYLSESCSFTASEASRATLERWSHKSQGEARRLRLDSPRDFGGSDNESLAESQRDLEINDELTSVLGPEVCSQEEEIENMEYPIREESHSMSHNTSTFEHGEDIQGYGENFLRIENNDMDFYNGDLQYVKYVLDIIGLTTREDLLEAWHSPNHPLDPALFDCIEVCCPFEPKSSNKEAFYMSSSHRKVLFDLINEALVDIQEKSYACFPKALSFWCHVHPMPKGKSRVVEEVWEFVSECLSWRPELDPSLDLAVAHDLSKNRAGWVNLQMDTEGLALDLEEVIFDELLDEIVCC